MATIDTKNGLIARPNQSDQTKRNGAAIYSNQTISYVLPPDLGGEKLRWMLH